MYRLEHVVYETHDFWALEVPHGYDVYAKSITHSTRCAQIGIIGHAGYDRAVIECNRRQTQVDKRI